MRTVTVAAIGLLTLGAAGTAIDYALAQSDAGAPPPGMMTPPFGGRIAHLREVPRTHGSVDDIYDLMQSLALIYDAPDKQLTATDVQTIAQGFLLLHGNHTWSVLNVQPDGENIKFQIATEQNAIVASFAMNRHTAHLERLN
jgi:hypothetical protein